MDYTEIRKLSLEAGELTGMDQSYTFYYDETNNVRKFYLREDDFNESLKRNFVIGGVCFEHTRYDLPRLFESLDLQKTVKEVKLKNIAKGNFLECMASKTLRLFLDGIFKSDLYVHFSNLNFLYFSIVDIVDSVESNGELHLPPVNRDVKDALYQIIKLDKEKFVKLFYTYNFPNIKQGKLIDFANDFINLLDLTSDEDSLHRIQGFKKFFRISAHDGSLPFLTDEEDNILIENFVPFYMRPMYLFKNSSHFFDIEKTIMPLINEMEINIDGKKISNYTFIDSTVNQYIQTSDILMGLLGKYFDYLSESPLDEIKLMLRELDEVSYSNLELLMQIIDKSNRKNRAFIHRVSSNTEMLKDKHIADYFLL